MSEPKTEPKAESKAEPKPGTPENGNEGEGAGSPAPGSERWNQVYARMKAAEDKAAKMQKEQEEREAKRLEETGKFKELYESVKSKSDLADELTASVQKYYEESIKGISEDHLSLVPDLPIHKKLEWVANAKAKGLFINQDQKPDPVKTFDGKPVKTDGKWWLTIDSKDPRFGTLDSAQYQEWKAHKSGTTGKPMAVGF